MFRVRAGTKFRVCVSVRLGLDNQVSRKNNIIKKNISVSVCSILDIYFFS